jgi:oligopeptide transport system ATP-binding protein
MNDRAESAVTLLSVRDLKVHFPVGKRSLLGTPAQSVRAVDGVSFDLGVSETLGVVGESGCGKSTLGRALVRLIEQTDGRVVWMGEELPSMHSEAMRKKRRDLQMIFQDPLASLDPRMTVEQIIGQPLRTFHPELSRARISERVFDMMRLVGLHPSMAKRFPHQFSGGQCQRIGIARALILQPKLIVCDEPVSALDVSIQAQIINLLQRLRRELDLSLLFISHNLSIVRHISDRVMVLYLGKVMESAPADEFFARPLHPYSQALLAAVPGIDPRKERVRPRITLQGEPPSPINPPSGCRFRMRCPRAAALCSELEPPPTDIGRGHVVACHYA